MKKIVIFLVLFLMSILNVFSDVIILKDGGVVKGSILSMNDGNIRIRASFGEITIEKEKIEKVYYNDADYYNEDKIYEKEQKEVRREFKTNNQSDYVKSERIYKLYKTNRNIGIGFIIPGAIITACTLTVGLPLLIWSIQDMYYYSNYDYDYDDEYDDDDDEYDDYDDTYYGYYYDPFFIIGLSSFITLLTVGIIFDIVAIVGFVKATRYIKKWRKMTQLSMFVGYRENEPSIGIKYRF